MSQGLVVLSLFAQGMVLLLLVWLVVHWGKWASSNHEVATAMDRIAIAMDKRRESTNALVHELQMRRIAEGSVNHVATFVDLNDSRSA